MGKKRKSDKDEEKIIKKIRKLEEKLKKKKDQKSTDVTLECSGISDVFGLREDEDSIYIPPSDWAGTLTSAPGSFSPHAILSEAEDEPNVLPEAPLPAERSSPQPGPSSETDRDKDLEESILRILGDAPQPEVLFGAKIHKNVAARWQEILAKGLPKETKDELVRAYLVPANCELLVPPILNPEAKAALPEALVKRDCSLMSKQKHIAAAIAALAQVIQMLITNEFSKEKLLKPVSDASRLLCDSHNKDTKIRRTFVISSINTSLKGALIDTNRDKYLFGENLTEKLNAAKDIEKSGKKFKNKSQTNKNIFNKEKAIGFKIRLNSALHPKPAGRFDAGPVQSTTYRILPSSSRMQPQPPAITGDAAAPAPACTLYATLDNQGSQRTTQSAPHPSTSCREIIRQSLLNKSLSSRSVDIMLSSLSENTYKQYNSAITKWLDYCILHNYDHTQPSIPILIHFLTEVFDCGAKYGTINSYKSAISLLLENNLDDVRLKKFMKGVFKLRPTRPK